MSNKMTMRQEILGMTEIMTTFVSDIEKVKKNIKDEVVSEVNKDWTIKLEESAGVFTEIVKKENAVLKSCFFDYQNEFKEFKKEIWQKIDELNRPTKRKFEFTFESFRQNAWILLIFVILISVVISLYFHDKRIKNIEKAIYKVESKY
jgi:hypothetical protein